jgi:hypothetical protein
VTGPLLQCPSFAGPGEAMMQPQRYGNGAAMSEAIWAAVNARL